MQDPTSRLALTEGEAYLPYSRQWVTEALRAKLVGVGVHHIPVHLHPFYRERFQTPPGFCPVAQAAYEETLSLPIFPAMAPNDVMCAVRALKSALEGIS